MDFKTETLFDIFQLSINLSSEELLKEFQINSKLRAELSKYIKIIKDPDLLAIEKHSSTFVNEHHFKSENYKNYDLLNLTINEERALCNAILRESSTSLIQESKVEDLVEIFESIFNFDNSFNITNKSLKENYISSLVKKVSAFFLAYVNNFNWDKINYILKIISSFKKDEIKNKIFNCFSDLLIEQLNKTDYSENSSIIWIAYNLKNINDIFYQNHNFYTGIEGFLNEYFSSDSEKYATIYLLPLILKLIRNESLENYNLVFEAAKNLIRLKLLMSYESREYLSINKNVKQLFFFVKKKQIENEDIKYLEALYALTNGSSDDINLLRINAKEIYLENDKNKIQTGLYNICDILRRLIKPELRDLIFDSVTEITKFNEECTFILIKAAYTIEYVNKSLVNKNRINYSLILLKTGVNFLTVEDTDDFIFKYYPLCLINEKLSKDIFYNLYNATTYPYELASLYGDFKLGIYGLGSDFCDDFFRYFPKDWPVSGRTMLDLANASGIRYPITIIDDHYKTISLPIVKRCDDTIKNKVYKYEELNFIDNDESCFELDTKESEEKKQEKYDVNNVRFICGLIAFLTLAFVALNIWGVFVGNSYYWAGSTPLIYNGAIFAIVFFAIFIISSYNCIEAKSLAKKIDEYKPSKKTIIFSSVIFFFSLILSSLSLWCFFYGGIMYTSNDLATILSRIYGIVFAIIFLIIASISSYILIKSIKKHD